MNDETYTFIETQRERKSTSRSARYRKSGAHSKRCSLPHERLTAKQLRERNGEMATYNLSGPMRWKEYRSMPDDLRKEYLLKLINEHGARAKDISEMMEVNPSTISKEIAKLGIKLESKNIRKQSFRWFEFVNGFNEPQESVEAEEVELPSEDINAPQSEISAVKQPEEILRLTNGKLFFVGEPAAVFEKMMTVLNPSTTYRIEIGFFEEKRRE